MLFHEVDTSFKRIQGCYKRAEHLAKDGIIDPTHPLATAWANCKFSLPENESKTVEEYQCVLQILDWFAFKVDSHLKKHLAEGDLTLGVLLKEWRDQLFFNPNLLNSIN